MSRTIAMALAAAACLSTPGETMAKTPTTNVAESNLFAREVAKSRQFLSEMMQAGIDVPQPKDPGGGATHEQHKRNYRALYEAGQLYRLNKDRRYRDYARDMLLAYAALYPKLGPHPARSSDQRYGKLYWQVLNDAVWLVNGIQAYQAIRADLTPDERARIDPLFRQMAEFLSVESVKTFDMIHNHATWATAGVGMTGYVLGDRDLVERALKGSRKDGSAGYLKQIDDLLSPDGYYAEGGYYQRYALWPFMVFANAIERYDPKVGIFKRRDGILIKTVRTAIDLTYHGHFIPFNDALKEKSLNTEELYQGVAIAYAQSRDPALLSVARWQDRVALSPEGKRVADDLAASKARPFPYRSRLLRDGADGRSGAVALIRDGDSETGQLLVAKNASQGMGHGHFDRLNWLYFDGGDEIVTDYGAARFHNVEAKYGGRYLPENESWAKQSIAHNVLLVDGRSHFDGKLTPAEEHPAEQLHFSDSAGFAISVGRQRNAYPSVAMTRAVALVAIPGLEKRVVVDLLRVESSAPHRYDLPLHYRGHLIELGPEFTVNTDARPVLGKGAGYEHIWIDAIASVQRKPVVTWQNLTRFHSWHWVPLANSSVILAESGAGDPRFALRREPMIIQRVEGAGNALFAGVLEGHGSYDPDSERVVASRSQIVSVEAATVGDADVMIITTRAGAKVAVAVAHSADEKLRHQVRFAGHDLTWTGPAARIVLK
jgi:oligo-alginate lyase